MAAEHDPTAWGWIADKVWAVASAAIFGLFAWVMRHEARVTRLEAQREESEHARIRSEAALSKMEDQINKISGKIDRLLGHCLGRPNGYRDE